MIIADRPKGSLKDVIHTSEVLIQGKFQRKLLEEIRETELELKERKQDSQNRIRNLRNDKEREIERLTQQLNYEEKKLN